MGQVSGSLPYLLRAAFVFSGKIHHDPTHLAQDYIEFVRQRERYFLGITKASTKAADYQGRSNQSFEPHDTPDVDRHCNDWSALLEQRLSAAHNSAAPTHPMKIEDIMAVLKDSYFRRQDSRRPFGSAGGFAAYDLYVLPRSRSSLKPFKVQHLDDRIISLEDQDAYRIVDMATATTDSQQWGDIWIVIVADIEQLLLKYGTRGYRFACIDVGGLVQQLHLSSTSYGLRFRCFGGFDDKVVEAGLDCTPNQIPLVSCLLGTEK